MPTIQMKVKRSCHLAFFISKVFDPKYAIRPRHATAANEVADVFVKRCGVVDSASSMVIKGGRSTEKKS
jgi:hypothetical protein